MHEGIKHSLEDGYTDDNQYKRENAVIYLYSLLTIPIKPTDKKTTVKRKLLKEIL